MPRRQNPQMHLFEAMIAAFDATHDTVFQNRAGDFFALFMANLYDKQKQVLGEYFEDDWSKIEPVSVEPGHQAEWVWLLKGFERITGCPTGRYRARIAGVGAALSRRGDRLPGRRGRRRRQHQATQPAPVAADRNRQGLDRAGRGGRGGRRRRSARGAGAARTALSQPSRRRAAGTISSTATAGRWSATIPASSFYHVLCAVVEAEQVLGGSAVLTATASVA